MSENKSNSIRLLSLLKENNLIFTVAESCTGGLISKKITDLDGSSSVFWGGFVTYSNEAKIKLLSVERSLLENYGAVSEETVIAMAMGALINSGASYSVSVSGIAGPDGGSTDKPVGTVWICAASASGVNRTCRYSFTGNRSEVREKAAESALFMVYNLILNQLSIDS